MKIKEGQVWYNQQTEELFIIAGRLIFFPSVGVHVFKAIHDDDDCLGYIRNLDSFYDDCVCIGKL